MKYTYKFDLVPPKETSLKSILDSVSYLPHVHQCACFWHINPFHREWLQTIKDVNGDSILKLNKALGYLLLNVLMIYDSKISKDSIEFRAYLP